MIYLYMLLGTIIGFAGSAAYGFYKGYQICNQSYQVKLLKAETQRLKLSLKYNEILKKAAEEETDTANKADLLNKGIIDDLQKQLEATSKGDCTFDDAFLRNTNKLR